MNTAARFTALLTLVAAGSLPAQELPTTQPAYLTIFMEEVKPGHEWAHEQNEKGWPAAFARANSTSYYLALESMTGPSHVWYASPYASFAAEAAEMKMVAENPTLGAELRRLWQQDGEHLVSARSVSAVARPDLSHGTFPDLTKTRFWEITTFQVHPGHEEAFAETAKTYAAMAARGAPEASWRVYQVLAGMEAGHFLIFSSFESYGQFDDMMAGGNRIMQAATPQEMERMQRFSRESLVMAISNRYSLNANMSYVDEATKAADPAFWSSR